MTLVTQQDAFLVLFVASCALDRLVMAVMRIGFELGRFFLDGIPALMTNHASRFLWNFARLDVAVASFAGKIHRFVDPLQGHGLGGVSRPCG